LRVVDGRVDLGLAGESVEQLDAQLAGERLVGGDALR
jgi:hypothetical protein